MEDKIIAIILVGYAFNLFIGPLALMANDKKFIELLWLLIPYGFFKFIL